MTALDVVPPLRGADPGTGTAPRRPRAGRTLRPIAAATPSRRSVLRAGAALGATVGMVALGVFPAARRAYADGYDIYGRCPSYATDHNCSPGCGPSTIFADACITSGLQTGFHKADGITWTLRPNQCYAGTYDGWLWRYQGACGTCACHVERRCHDGYRQTASGWVRSICRWNTDCGCQGAVSWPAVRRGASGPNVSTVQHLQNFRGAALTVDGIFGASTETAVRNFQSAGGLPVTGVVDAGTWPTLVATVRRGDRNEAVRGVQRQLNKYAYALAVDGIFGAGTDAAVRDYQLTSAIAVDGIAGQSTWRSLAGGAGA
jgi:hypothetical protein